jgi:hypothetical protein
MSIGMKNLLCLLLLCLAGGCKLPDKGVLDTTQPPFISQATTSPNSIDVSHLGTQPTSPIDTTIIFSVSVDSGNTSALVTYTLFDPSGNVFSSGNFAGSAGKFSASAGFHILKEDVGTYGVQFQAVAINDAQNKSNILAQAIVVKNANHSPVVSDLVMPDTVSIPPAGDTTFVKITIAASDSDGQGDIVSVTLTSQKPDGSSAGVFYLYDDGNSKVYTQFGAPLTSGDAAANDGIYTITIPLTTVTGTLPTYRIFSFMATDRSGAFSNIISKRIYIIQ